MPRRRPRLESAEAAAIPEISSEIERMVDGLVGISGPAPGAARVSDARLLEQWAQRDPKILDPEGLKQQLMTSGLPPELLDPQSPSALAIVKAQPELAQVLASPVDERLADMLSRLAEFPLRTSVLAPFQDDPKEAVSLAERLDRQWQRSLQQAAPPAAPPEAPIPPIAAPTPPIGSLVAPEAAQGPLGAPEPAEAAPPTPLAPRLEGS